jgi:pantetheine-phosphate adenylyltransferase
MIPLVMKSLYIIPREYYLRQNKLSDKGHLNILEKAEKMFDKVIIVKGNNPDKQKDDKIDRILRTPKMILNREIIEWEGLTTELMKVIAEHSEVTLIRGLRDGKDLDYEINQLRFMEDMFKELNVCFVHCDKEYEHISSSAIRKIDIFSHEEAKKYLL